jgi:glycosyltransferase involved in cell wall biosynthesis
MGHSAYGRPAAQFERASHLGCSGKANMTLPPVSVVMSVYNGERYLAAAMDSILSQTFGDFEFIIINDGSTDRTADILRSYSDPRVLVVEQANVGLTRSLNRGIALARGKYIARMDADDISLPERFARQMDFFDTHPTVGVVGTACRVVNELDKTEQELHFPLSDEQLRPHLIRGNPFVHTSVMMRKSVLEAVGGYNEAYPFAQDYELWVRLAAHTQLANLPEVLVMRRFHWDAVSTTSNTELLRLWLRMRIHYQAFRSLDYPIYYFFYVLQPILFTLIELRPKLAAYLKQLVRPTK